MLPESEFRIICGLASTRAASLAEIPALHQQLWVCERNIQRLKLRPTDGSAFGWSVH
ncbi:MAG: hypothetical protein WC975_04510 [Phycisphaerae bacterium]